LTPALRRFTLTAYHNCNKPDLTAALKLRPEQRVLFAQTVGYPAKG
jgi:hypothetical protein